MLGVGVIADDCQTDDGGRSQQRYTDMPATLLCQRRVLPTSSDAVKLSNETGKASEDSRLSGAVHKL